MSGMGVRLSSNTHIHKGKRKKEPKFLRKRIIFKKPNLNTGVEGIDKIHRLRQCVHIIAKNLPGLHKETQTQVLRTPNREMACGLEHVVILEDLGFISRNSHSGS